MVESEEVWFDLKVRPPGTVQAACHFWELEQACIFAAEAEAWRDTCPRPTSFLGVANAFPKPEAMAYPWLICDSARAVALIGVRR